MRRPTQPRGALAAALMLVGASLMGIRPLPAAVTPEFEDVSVHDPSLIRVDDTFYVFGSHLAAAKTSDFVRWEMVADGVDAANPLFDDVVTELDEVFDWTGVVGLWANDVIQLEDGRFYMYYNLSRLDSPRAAMGLAIADDIEGPYIAQGVFLRSGMWDQISEDGVNVYDARIHPNVVDPDAFFDHKGNLWMIYGSYSGGIFILKMNPRTGLPRADQGYGKHLMGGNHSRIEGACILYSPDTHYYYMFTSFGGLSADGGYNIRVSRSLEPDGPYLDALGNDMAEVKADPSLPLFDDASVEPFAQKLMGSHLFEGWPDDPIADTGYGYVSPGHNTAYYDEDTGRYLLIFHTRFPGSGEFHQVRVHEMFINDAGWPVIAPHRYAPQARRSDRVKRRHIPGEYDLVDHGKDISAELKTSRFVRLEDDGRITGEVSGGWEYQGNGRIGLFFDDTGDSWFEGAASRQWSEARGKFVVTLTATSAEGVTVWGTRMKNRKPSFAVGSVKPKRLQAGKKKTIKISGSGFPDGLAIELRLQGMNDTDIRIRKIKITSGRIRMKVNVAPQASEGPRSIVLTAPDFTQLVVKKALQVTAASP